MAVRVWDCVILALAAFAVLATAIVTRPEKRLNDFDQSFYLTIAHDLDRWGVFGNGIFDQTDSTEARPEPGMFFLPVYPALVYLVMQADPRFRTAVICNTEANHHRRPLDDCEFYATPMRLVHAGLLALAVLAIALTGQSLFGGRLIFPLSGALATLGLVAEADLFSFVMTESTTIALFSFAAYAYVVALQHGGWIWTLAAGAALGLLVLARPSFALLVPAWSLAIVLHRWKVGPRTPVVPMLGALLAGAGLVVSPWVVRNAVVVGKPGLSEEYGSAALIERFAFDTMTAREFALAFPYCVPVVGPPLVQTLFGSDAMSRFAWDQPGSFFAAGRAQREALVAEHGKLDPVIGSILRSEMNQRGLAYLLTTIPMAWCGLWVAGPWALLLLPIFGLACLVAVRQAPAFLAYAAPGLLVAVAHAAVGNHYPRYNLMLIGPISVGSAWMARGLVASWGARRQLKQQKFV